MGQADIAYPDIEYGLFYMPMRRGAERERRGGRDGRGVTRKDEWTMALFLHKIEIDDLPSIFYSAPFLLRVRGSRRGV